MPVNGEMRIFRPKTDGDLRMFKCFANGDLRYNVLIRRRNNHVKAI